jgi:hypothetical protein
MPDRLTMDEVLALFGRSPEVGRWVASADSQEYLTLVAYLVERSTHR